MRTLALLLLVGLGLAPEAGAQALAVSPSGVDIQVPFTGVGFGTGVDTGSLLRWRGLLFSQTKVTVETVAPGQAYGLSVEATSPYLGRSAGRVVLQDGAPARDLVTDIPGTILFLFLEGRTTLRYEATVTGMPASGSDDHTVVYTITQQ